jgi:ribosomal protein L11 methylase PrmA
MRPAFNIAPRVLVYPHGSPPPPMEEGWLALAQFESWPPAALDSPPSPEPGFAPQSGCSKVQTRGRGLAPAAGGLIAAPQRHGVFGDGSHPTTRLCAGAIDLLCRRRPGLAVLDVGTGTGILARIAAARGATYVVGTDIDSTAVACAKAHAELDNLASPGCRLPEAAGVSGAAIGGRAIKFAGEAGSGPSIANIHFGSEPPDHWGARFELVVANILEAPLHALAPALCRALSPGGVLLISGFTRPQAPALRLAYGAARLKSAGDFALDDWVLLKFTAP